MKNLIIVLTVSISLFGLSNAQGVDLTVQVEASGTSVVLAVVNRIIEAFGSDNLFLRRVAYVETKDGTDSDTFRSNYYGGIWQVDESVFQRTQDVTTYPELSSNYTTILDTFGIDWPTVQWTDLRKPLFSGIAVRLFVLTLNMSIPCDISGQATYWKTNYNSNANDTEQMYINDTQTLNQIQDCRVNSDIMFVLDESGSVTSPNFEIVRQFVIDYVNRLPIGPMDNQVGVITFDSFPNLIFDFDAHGSRTSLINAIRSIPYNGGGTHIPRALCEMQMAFTSSDTGVRMDSTVFRIGIFMTDGFTSTGSTVCGYSTVEEAAATIHSLVPPILVFAISVGDNVNFEQIRTIASGPEFVSAAESFSTAEFECIQTVQEDNLCFRVSTPMNINETNTGMLEEEEEVRWQFPVPFTGITCIVRATQGRVVFYASTKTTAPNQAFYEWTLTTSSTASVDIIPERGSNTGETTQVFVTISGLAASNTFSLDAEPLQSSCDASLN